MTSNTSAPTVEEQESKTLSEIILDEANTSNLDAYIAEEIASGHRFLQQEVFYGLLKPAIISLANNHTDRRNENAVQECQQIVNELGWDEEDV